MYIKELLVNAIFIAWMPASNYAKVGSGTSMSDFIEEMAPIGKNCVPLPIRNETVDCPLNGRDSVFRITNAVFQICNFYGEDKGQSEFGFSLEKWNFIRGFALTAIKEHVDSMSTINICGCCLEDNKDGKCGDYEMRGYARSSCGKHVMRAIGKTLNTNSIINSLKSKEMETTDKNLCRPVDTLFEGRSIVLSKESSVHVKKNCFHKGHNQVTDQHAVLKLCGLDEKKPGFCGFRPLNWFGVGRSIKDRCQAGDRIPIIPIGTFKSNDRSYDDGHVAIFMNCTNTGAWVAAQWCRKAFHQRHIQFADLYRYYEIGSSIELEKKYRCNPYLNGPYD